MSDYPDPFWGKPLRTETTMHFKEHTPRTFNADTARAEEGVPFGEVTKVGLRWSFRVGVARRGDETYLDATSRVMAGRGGILGNDHFTPACRMFRGTSWVGCSGPNKKAIERILEAISPMTTGRLIPGDVAREMLG